ncbi:MAG: hypothetical protein ACO1OY_05250 [Ramlibacter sp.]|jgi:hypothetical protein
MTLRRWLLGWVLVALVGAQALGFVHRIAHGPHSPAHAHAIQPQAHWADALFAGHDGERDCRLFDALGLDQLPLAVPALPALPAAATGMLLPAAALLAGRCPSPYRARGPPPSR